jgi:predicted Na+-dependent transporter
MRWIAAIPRLLTPIALLAAALAIVAPSAALARHSDLLLAALVLATALGISHRDLARLRRRAGAIVLLSVLPVPALGAIAWVLGRPFSATIQDGLLGVGLSSSEVAAVGLVALAGADATIALGAVAGSLVVAALVGPLAIGWLGGGGHADSAALLGRFALVVILPLGCGVTVRSFLPRLGALDRERDGVAAAAVALLVYAALSGTHGAHHLAAAALASLAFLGVCAGLGELWRRRAADGAAVPGALAIAMRDFAVAAALATQAFGTSAGTVPGVYGVLMLVAGTVAAGRLRGAS